MNLRLYHMVLFLDADQVHECRPWECASPSIFSALPHNKRRMDERQSQRVYLHMLWKAKLFPGNSNDINLR